MTIDLKGALVELAELLEAGGVRKASPDPAALSLPGVWVQAIGIDCNVLDEGSYEIQGRLMCIVDDNGVLRSIDALSALVTQVTDVLPATGLITPQLVTLPGNLKPMPALAVPVTFQHTPGETP